MLFRSIKPNDPTVNIQIGGTAPTGTLDLQPSSLSNLNGGFNQIVIGGGTQAPGQDITIVGTTTAIVFTDPVVLNVTGTGSTISVEGSLQAEGLTAKGAVVVEGTSTITTGNGSGTTGGNAVFEQTIDGNTNSTADKLTLAAGGDSVIISGKIGATTPLDSLTVNNAVNVTFSQTVSVDGDLTINATGTVRFDDKLTISSGKLTIKGASEVIIGEVVMTSPTGEFVIEANTLNVTGDIKGSGTVVLRPSDVSKAISFGVATPAAGSMNVSTTTLGHLAGCEEDPGLIGQDGRRRVGMEPLGTVAEALRLLSTLLAPVMPTACAKMRDQLGLPTAAPGDWLALTWGGFPVGTKVGAPVPLFPRKDLADATPR